MLKEEIQRQIRQCQKEIEVARLDIARLEDDRYEYTRLGNQLTGKLSELRARQENRRARAVAIGEVSGVPKLARSITSAFDGALDGYESRRATMGLSDAIDRVSRELQSVDSRMEDRLGRVRQLESRIEELRVQLSALAADQAR